MRNCSIFIVPKVYMDVTKSTGEHKNTTIISLINEKENMIYL